jgi:Tol biopolymer transport system component
MNANGSNQHTLIDDPELIETDPAFTPDGANVIFTGASTVSKPDVHAVPVTGGTPIDLTNNAEEDKDPDACATNGKVAFVSARTGDNDIWVMDPNGSNQTDLTEVSASQEFEALVLAGLLSHRLHQQPGCRQL